MRKSYICDQKRFLLASFPTSKVAQGSTEGGKKNITTQITFYRLLRYKAGTWSQEACASIARLSKKKQRKTATSIDLGYRFKSKLKYSNGFKKTNKTWDWRNAKCLLTGRQDKRFRSNCRVSVSCCVLTHHQAGVKMKNVIKKKKRKTITSCLILKLQALSAGLGIKSWLVLEVRITEDIHNERIKKANISI